MDDSLSEYGMMQTAIGQGTTLITPMPLNMITCAIANDGVLMEPYLISGVESCDGQTVTSYEPKAYSRLMTEKEAQILTELMMAVCDYGTARKFEGEGYTAAGKTGSAEYGLIPGEDGVSPPSSPERSSKFVIAATKIALKLHNGTSMIWIVHAGIS